MKAIIGKINNIANKIKAMIQRVDISLSEPLLKGNYPVAQVKGLGGKSSNLEYIYPYGIEATPPQAGQTLKFNIQGQSSNQVGIPFDQTTLRSKLPDEVIVGNTKSGAYFKFTILGTIEVWNLISGEDVLVIADLITHLHSGVTTGGGTSGPPV